MAAALESLSVLAGGTRTPFVPSTPSRLRAARTCYDHIAGLLGVSLHDRFQTLRWISADLKTGADACDLTPSGAREFAALGMNVETIRAQRRRFAYACIDWSERRPHLGGALAAAILNLAVRRKWVLQDLDSRSLSITRFGRREMASRFGLSM